MSFKSSMSTLLNFDVQSKIVIGFAFHWTWVWILFWSSLFYSVEPRELRWLPGAVLQPLGTLWTWSLLSMLVTLLAICAFSQRFAAPSNRTALPIAGAGLTTIGTLLLVAPKLIFADSTVSYAYLLGVVLTGVGSAITLMLWGELLSMLGSRRSVVYFVSATVLSAAVYVALILLPGMVGRVVASLLPIAEMVLYSKEASLPKHTCNPSDAAGDLELPTSDRSSLALVLFLSTLFGISYGMMKGLFVFSDAALINARDACNILSMILGSAAIFASMAVYKMDFNRMTWQISLPLMAAGFLMFPLQGALRLVGFTVHQFGYQYFYAVIWAMWALTATDEKRVRTISLSLAGVQGGQLAGSILGSSILFFVGNSPFGLAVVASWTAFAIMFIALFSFGSAFGSSRLSLMRPFAVREGRSKRQSGFGRAMDYIAVQSGLSERETEVFQLLARGRNRSYIAERLTLSEGTVKTHIKHVYHKIGVHSQQDLIDVIELESRNR